jgi:uncharacterized membrane protein
MPPLDLNRMLAAMFLLFAAPLCLFFAMVVPFGQVADEPSHIQRADSLIHGELIGRRSEKVSEDGIRRTVAGIDADLGLLVAAFPVIPPAVKVEQANIDRSQASEWAPTRTFVDLATIVTYMPAFYLPTGLTLGAAKLLHLSPYHAIRAARLVDTLCFLLLGTAALLLARRGQVLLFCTLTVPMTLSLGSSCNQDGLIVASVILATALLTRSWDRGETIVRRRSYQIAAFLLALVIATKPPYFPLAAMLLIPLPSWRSFAKAWRMLVPRGAVVALTLLPGLLWNAYALRYVAAAQPIFPAYHGGPLWPGDPSILFTAADAAAQLKVLLAQPLLMVTLPLESLGQTRMLAQQFVGSLGWLMIYLPSFLYTLWGIGLGAALLADLTTDEPTPASAGWQDFALLLLACIAAIFAVWLSQYLTWTPVGATHIEGPQGRYLLPILPMLAVALPGFAVPGGRTVRRVLSLAPGVALAVGLLVLPGMVVSTFYLR